MAYKKIWVDGEVITAKELNRLEDRISENGGGSGGGSEVLEELIPFHNMNGCIVCNGEEITLNVGIDVEVGQILSFKYEKSKGYKVHASGTKLYDSIKQPVAESGYSQDTFVIEEGYTICKLTGAYFVIVPVGENDGSGLPTVTEADNGKILQVVNGAWEMVDGYSKTDIDNLLGSYINEVATLLGGDA